MIIPKTPSRTRAGAQLLGIMLAAVGSTSSVFAASGNWTGSADSTWAGANWSATPAPGAGDTATFNAASGNTTIDLGSGVTVGTVVFDTAAAAADTNGTRGAGAQTLAFGDTGTITMNSTVASNQLFNANLTLGTAVTGTTTITNSSTTNTITFAGTIQGGSGGTAGVKTLNTAGAGSINFTNSLGAGGGTVLNLTNTGTATSVITLSGSGSSSFGTLRATANGTIVVNGQTVTVANSSGFGGNSTTNGKFELQSGSASFNGGITSGNTGDSTLIKVSGGTFSAASISLGRTSNPGTTLPSSVTTGSGFVVTGGNASVTGNVTIGTSNSAATSHISGGNLTVNGRFGLGNTSNNRYSMLQVSGGNFTITDATNGLVLGLSSTTANSSGALFTGGTSTVERISFGVSNAFAGSTGAIVLNGASASLYLGSGGIVQDSTNTYNRTINLTNGTLGAKADWASSLAMNLNGSGVTIKAADAADVSKNITLSGVLSGANGFTKIGGGSLTLSGANTYSGATIINAGQINAGNAGALGTGNVTLGGGTLVSSVSGVSGVGTVTFNSGGLNLNDTSTGSLTLAANKNFSMSGGTWSVSIGSTSSYDQVIGSGTGTFGITGGSIALSGISDYSVGYSLFSGFASGSVAGLTISGYDTTNWIASLGNDGLLTFAATAVPEPSTFALLGGFAALGCVGLRRRRRA